MTFLKDFGPCTSLFFVVNVKVLVLIKWSTIEPRIINISEDVIQSLPNTCFLSVCSYIHN